MKIRADFSRSGPATGHRPAGRAGQPLEQLNRAGLADAVQLETQVLDLVSGRAHDRRHGPAPRRVGSGSVGGQKCLAGHFPSIRRRRVSIGACWSGGCQPAKGAPGCREFVETGGLPTQGICG